MKSNMISGRRGIRNPFAAFIGGPIFAIAGLIMGFFGWRSYNTTRIFLNGAEHARGSVVDLVARQSTDSDGNSSTMYYPVVEFTTADGQAIRYQSSTGSNPAAQHVGDSVDMVYAPGDPQNARINSFTDLWLMPLILLGFGALFALVGVGAFFNAIALIAGLGGLLALLFFWRKKSTQNQNPPAGNVPPA